MSCLQDEKPALVAGFLLVKSGKRIYPLLFLSLRYRRFTLIPMQNNRYHSVTRIYT